MSLGSADSVYGWAGTAAGMRPPAVIVGADAAASNSVTIPTHLVGDLIIIFAYRGNNNAIPTKPTAGGGVPTWTDIDASSGANTNSSRTAY